MLFDRFDASRPIRTGSRHNNGNGPVFLFLGQGAKKHIDGMIESAVYKLRQQKLSTFQGHIVFRWNQIYGILMNGHLIFRLHYLHFRMFSQNICHKTAVIGGKMLNDNKAQPAVAWHMLKKLL